MEIPTHLSHKPIVKLEEYSQLDGRLKIKLMLKDYQLV